MKSLNDLSLKDITPPNLLLDDNISAIVQAIDSELLTHLSPDILQTIILPDIDSLPEVLIDLLAVQLHVDFYDLAGTLSMKREAVKNSILWHMHKGTEWAILEALRMIDIQAEFVPWWVDNSLPYTFKLKAIVSGDFYRTQGKDKLISSIRRAVNEAKSARSFLAGLETRIDFKENISLFQGIIPFLSGTHTIRLPKPDNPPETHISAGTVSMLQGEHKLFPYRLHIACTTIFLAPVAILNISHEIGVDLLVMQELLRQFENRIFSRIDNLELKTQADMQEQHRLTMLKLDEILDLLRWKDFNDA